MSQTQRRQSRTIDKALDMIRKTFTGGVRCYTEWSSHYDEDMDLLGFNAPEICAQITARCIGGNTNARIIDFCAGTGKVGEELARLGFTNVDAVDANEAMLNVAKKKQIYKNVYQQLITLGDEKTCLEKGSYDVATASGTFYDGGLPVECLPELIRVTKPGGIIVIVRSCDKHVDIWSSIHTLVEHGAIKIVERIKTKNHILRGNGEGIVLRVN